MITFSYRSEEINLVSGALSKAQGIYKEPVMNCEGPNGRYANLQAILNATREALATNALAFNQYEELIDNGAGGRLLKSVISHESGQYISSCARIPVSDHLREDGNTLEIIKRRHAQMLLGIAPSPQDHYAMDDDGAADADKKVLKSLREVDGTEKPKAKTASGLLTHDQYNDLKEELKGFPKLAEDTMKTYGVDTLADLPREDYFKIRNRILKIKKIEADYESRS